MYDRVTNIKSTKNTNLALMHGKPQCAMENRFLYRRNYIF